MFLSRREWLLTALREKGGGEKGGGEKAEERRLEERRVGERRVDYLGGDKVLSAETGTALPT